MQPSSYTRRWSVWTDLILFVFPDPPQIWKPGNGTSPLGDSMPTTDATCPCFSLTPDNFTAGSLILIKEVEVPFQQAEVILVATGLNVDFEHECSMPIMMMMTDEEAGKLGDGECQPTCGPVKRCQLECRQEGGHHFLCQCPSDKCFSIGLMIPPKSMLAGSMSAQICAMHIMYRNDNGGGD